MVLVMDTGADILIETVLQQETLMENVFKRVCV